MKKMARSIADHLNISLCKHRRNSVIRALDRIALRLHKGIENFNHDHRTNGELDLLRKLADAEPTCIFDVGANRGAWAKLAHQTFSKATIHCFEIAPPTFENLVFGTRGYDRVRLNNFGLSDQSGNTILHFDAEQDGLTSGIEIVCASNAKQLMGKVSTGDEYVRANGVNSIDLLKIDVEGMEERVLRGFQKSLENKVVKAIQFEYGMVSIATHFLLRDFYQLLDPFGFVIGKIYPTYVAFREYDFRHENFVDANFLAVHRESPVLPALR